MNTIAAARLFLDNDVDPIVQMSCRNRNRLALVADLLGASALGVNSVLLIRGGDRYHRLLRRARKLSWTFLFRN